MYLFVKIYPSAIPGHSFPTSTLIPSLKKIGKGMPKIESENQFLTSIKGCNSVLICQNLTICNPRTLLPNINFHSEFEENWLRNAPSREWKQCADGRTYGRTYRTDVLRFLNGPWPLQIDGVNLVRLTPQAHFNPVTPYCTNPNLTLTSLNTAVQIANLIMYRGHADRWTDGRTLDRHFLNGGYNIIPRAFI